jgi:hypothetical protein
VREAAVQVALRALPAASVAAALSAPTAFSDLR